MRRKLIVLMGLDGSGKTTQAELISQHLRAMGVPTQVVWMRGESYLTLPILKLAKALLRAPKEAKRGEGVQAGRAYERYVRSKQTLFRNRLFRSIWRSLALFDLYLGFKVAFANLAQGTTVVVLDRYVYDTLIDIDSAFGAKGAELERLLGSSLLKPFPRPEKVILLEISPEEAMRRKDDIPSVEYLIERHGLYDKVATAVGAVRIDGTGTVEGISSKMIDEIMEIVS